MFDCEDEVNLIREAYLAGIRFWIERILAKRIPFRSPDDFAAFNRLSKVALEIVREAYTREAPSTLLGEDERDILRLTFPLWSQTPAESWIDDEELQRRWNRPNDEEWCREDWSFDEFAEDCRFFRQSDFGRVVARVHSNPPRDLETDFWCHSIGVAFADWIAAEARRARVDTQVPDTDINDEQDALKFVTGIAARCATQALQFSDAAIPSNDAEREQEQHASPSDLPPRMPVEVRPKLSRTRPTKEWWATKPPREGWHDKPLIGTQKELAHCVGVALRRKPVDVKTLPNMHGKSVWIFRVNETTWQAYFHKPEFLATANAALIELRKGTRNGADGSEAEPMG
jgi:hypothetical protein